MNCIDLNPSLTDFLTKQKYCDVKFICKDFDGNSTSIGAHKLILSMVSDVFEAMFFGESVQRGLLTDEREIDIPDIDINALKLFLRYPQLVRTSTKRHIFILNHFLALSMVKTLFLITIVWSHNFIKQLISTTVRKH